MPTLLELPATRISQHLSTLRAYRFVNERSDGRHRIYNLTIPGIAPWLVVGVHFVIDCYEEVSPEQGEDAKRLWQDAFCWRSGGVDKLKG